MTLSFSLRKKDQAGLDSDRIDTALWPTNFTEIIEYISALKKPLVTHNGLLDILHLYNSFIGPLHESQGDFKKEFLANFPALYDTKYLINSSNILLPEDKISTSLSDCFGYFDHSDPKVILSEEFSGYDFS